MENLPLPPASGGDEDGTPESLRASINTFCEITSASQSEALFYLESHNYSLDSAVSTYLETTVSAAAAAAAATHNPPAQTRLPSQSDSDSPVESPSDSPSRSRSPSPTAASRQSQYNLRSKSKSKSKSKSTAVGNSSRITTFADLNQRSGHDGCDSDCDDEPQGYYTGGEKSGMLVQDPSKANDVDAIFKQAREAGGIDASAEHLNPSSSSRNFAGTARLLSGESVTAAAPQQPEILTHNIVFWSDGFSVDDGPLRRLDDPQNASFLESIKKSECPDELQPADRRTPVHVNLSRKEQKYPVQKKTRAPFKGVGRTLGSTSNPDESSPSQAASFTTAPAPSIGLVVDETNPSTSIQLRLADGTRMVSRFNLSHTVRDIRGFIDASRPGGSRVYQLQTVGFPPKVLNELDQSIEEAGLANSVVIQKTA